MNTQYLKETEILNYNHPAIQRLIDQLGLSEMDTMEAIKIAYDYVKDEIKFGYNQDDAIPASEVLDDGYGQCNTKASLFMALLRAVEIPCRFHGFTIFNDLQKGAIPGIFMMFAPERILHSWVEVQVNGQWINLEGLILDKAYVANIQQAYPGCKRFSGYGVSVNDLHKLDNEFDGTDTYIQVEGIADDFGLFDSPDEFYNLKGSNMQGVKKLLYRFILRHIINFNVNKIRKYGLS